MKQKCNVNYDISQSILYKLHSKRKLSDILGIPLNSFKVLKNDSYYSCFDLEQKNKIRSIQQPIDQLFIVHQRIASLLGRIHHPDYLHSGRKKHSIITNASQHLFSDKRTLTIDIESFFTSTTRDKVFQFFMRELKQSPDVADTLSHLLTFNDHVPTGSPASMSIAFWANKRLFDELSRFSKNRDTIMTVYVDDLTFTGCGVNSNFLTNAKKIIEKYNLKVKENKIFLYKENQAKFITGTVVLNNKLDAEFKQLKELRIVEKLFYNDPENEVYRNSYNGRLAFLSQIKPNLRVKMDFK
ncbi:MULTISPECIES: reverse transcriptase family protein [Acinetobacter]|uniref:reverse transcriptase family protein n=1 Tax=Acinetobacter TaxID=469 RepID=UPI00029E28C1|nr:MULTISPECIES: reverse transcriptase family protein [Acinetobacter]EKU57430.1 hypothetical protein ACINWC323_3631 [Acinetobacter sp. WC-323]